MKNIVGLFILYPIFYFSQITLNTTVLETNFGGDSSPKEIIKIDNKLFFTAVNYEENFTEKRKVFLKQNLTAKATAININNNQYNSVSIVGNLGSVVFIIVDVNYSTDKQIWRTDGTSSGTYLVKNINNTAGTDITKFTFLDDKFFFTYYNANSNHLWASDGTSANTNQLGSFSSMTNLAPLNGNVIFSTQNNSGNTLIYGTNGTIGGTNIISSFPVGVSAIYQVESSGSFYYFLKSQNGISKLCKSDLSGNITVVKDLQQYETNLNGTAINNKFVFSVKEFLNGSNKSVIYSFNETDNSTTVLNNNYSFVGNKTSFKGKLYFSIIDSNSTNAIVSTDGTISGTQNLSSLYNIPNIYMLTKTKDSQYLIFKDLSDIYLLNANSVLPQKVTKESLLFEFNDLLDFTMYDNSNIIFAGKNYKNGNELFFNTNNTTSLLEDINHFGSTSFVSPVELNDKVIFFGNDFRSGQYEPAISDGTISGTKIIKDLNPGGFGSTHYSDNPTFFKNGNKLFFRCANGIAANEPCVTDGTAAGTKLIKKLNMYNVGSLAADPYYMHLNDNEVLFAADGNTNNLGGDYNLWKTDGTEAGTIFVHSVYPSKGSYDHKVSSVKINNFVYFTGQADLNDNPAIWKTDGSAAGTQFIKSFPIPSSSYYYFPKIIAKYDNKLFIMVSHWSANSILYMYDTNTNSSIQLKMLNSYSSNFHTNNNNLYFVGDNKLLTINMISNQISESTYNTGSSNFIDFKQCNDNLFVHMSDANMYSSKLFLVNNQSNHQITLPDGAITSSTCIDDRLLYVSRTSTSLVQKVIKMTDGNNFTNINLQNNNQNVDLINNSFNTVYNIFKVGTKVFFHSFFPQLNSDGSELYLVNNYNQLLNVKEHNTLQTENLDFITIYPNPSSDYVNIKSDKKFTLQNVSAVDMSGKQFIIKSINGKNQFYIRDLNSGVYIIKIKTDIGTFHKKFIKK